MSFRRYIAATSRDAMAQVRRELGPDAVILSSKRAGDAYEIVAAHPHAMERFVEAAPAPRVRPTPAVQPAAPSQAQSARAASSAANATAVAPMRTGESFQEYVRRQTQVAQAAVRGAPAKKPAAAASAAAAARYQSMAAAEVTDAESDDDLWKPTTFHVPPSETPAARERAPSAVVPDAAAPLVPARLAHRAPATVAPTQYNASTRLPTRHLSPQAPAADDAPAVFRRRGEQPVPAAESAAVAAAAMTQVSQPSAHVAPAADAKLLAELQAMRDQLQQQITALSSSVASTVANSVANTVQASRAELQSQIATSLNRIQAATRDGVVPLSGRVMTRLLTAGFSAEVARKIAMHVPGHLSLTEAESWLQDVLALNLKTVPRESSFIEAGGTYALVGPTGVGKTTTVAKLAAHFAVKYGSGALGLITLDAYRVGAHDQLRAYGRILGTPVFLAQDGETLRELVVSMQSKRLVLIDTCGVSQRDGRLAEVLSMLSAANAGVPEAMRIQRVLLANAASHVETLDDAARAWRAPECAGLIMTKLDEAARIGGALDLALRYKLKLAGVTNGQRVPEDWHAANPRVLAHLALKPGADAFAIEPSEAMALADEVRAATRAGSRTRDHAAA